jgi:hypothetical protein
MLKALLGLLSIGLVVSTPPTVVDPSQWSHYDAHRTKTSIIVDGLLTDKEWGKAPVMDGFSDVFEPGREVKYPTTAKMLWDDKYLYVAFECIDPDIWGVRTKHDDPVYIEDAAEVFIDPEGQGRHYFEVDVSAMNTSIDLMILSPSFVGLTPTNSRYDVKGLKTGVKVYGTLNKRDDKDEKWTLEMAIPWSDFMGRKVNVPPHDGDSWHINLFRVAGPKPYPDSDQLLSWSKSPGVFHEPKNFGVITFRTR